MERGDMLAELVEYLVSDSGSEYLIACSLDSESYGWSERGLLWLNLLADKFLLSANEERLVLIYELTYR